MRPTSAAPLFIIFTPSTSFVIIRAAAAASAPLTVIFVSSTVPITVIPPPTSTSASPFRILVPIMISMPKINKQIKEGEVQIVKYRPLQPLLAQKNVNHLTQVPHKSGKQDYVNTSTLFWRGHR